MTFWMGTVSVFTFSYSGQKIKANFTEFTSKFMGELSTKMSKAFCGSRGSRTKSVELEIGAEDSNFENKICWCVVRLK